MNTLFTLKTTLATVALLALPLAQATTLSRSDYSAGKSRASADYKADKAACASMSGNAKDICVEEAKGKEKVARAELAFSYTGKPKDESKVLTARADAAYNVAKERCDDRSGNDKDVCVKEAKSVKAKTMADVKLGKKIDSASATADDSKRKANYKVAAEKCDAMSGDAKSACMTSAKAMYGSN
jgi:hypothetical protein